MKSFSLLLVTISLLEFCGGSSGTASVGGDATCIEGRGRQPQRRPRSDWEETSWWGDQGEPAGEAGTCSVKLEAGLRFFGPILSRAQCVKWSGAFARRRRRKSAQGLVGRKPRDTSRDRVVSKCGRSLPIQYGAGTRTTI